VSLLCIHVDIEAWIGRDDVFGALARACRVMYEVLPLTFLKELYDELAEFIDSEVDAGSITARISSFLGSMYGLPSMQMLKMRAEHGVKK